MAVLLTESDVAARSPVPPALATAVRILARAGQPRAGPEIPL